MVEQFRRPVYVLDADVRIPCEYVPQPGWVETLSDVMLNEIALESRWEHVKDPHVIVRALTYGPCLTLLTSKAADLRDPERAQQLLANLHKECLANNLAPVCSLNDELELVLIPQRATDGEGKQQVPVFLGYSVAAGARMAAANFIEGSRLPLVLDLDETLLCAYTSKKLFSELHRLQHERMEAQATGRASEAELREQQKVKELLQEDLKMLQEFEQRLAVNIEGREYEAKDEEARGSRGELVTRKVLRLSGFGVTLTQIVANRRDTCMLLRTRPGWGTLKAFLLCSGRDDQLKPAEHRLPRFKVYICTTAETGYAHEAWRLLDEPNDQKRVGMLIPLAERARRIACVRSGNFAAQQARCKGLEIALALGAHPPGPGPVGTPVCAMPMAVIADDRDDVWQDIAKPQILRVQPFEPYRQAAAAGMNKVSDLVRLRYPEASEEMTRVQEVLKHIRSRWFQVVNDVLTPALRNAPPWSVQALVDGSALAGLPRVPSMSSLLREAAQQVRTPNPEGPDADRVEPLAVAGVPPAAAAAAAESDLLPMDPRTAGCISAAAPAPIFLPQDPQVAAAAAPPAATQQQQALLAGGIGRGLGHAQPAPAAAGAVGAARQSAAAGQPGPQGVAQLKTHRVDARQMAAAPRRGAPRAVRGREGGAHAGRGRGRGQGPPDHPARAPPNATPLANQGASAPVPAAADAAAAAGQKRGVPTQAGRPAKRQHVGEDVPGNGPAGGQGADAAAAAEAAAHENGGRSGPAPSTSIPALPGAPERPCAASPVLPARRAKRPPLSPAQRKAFLDLARAAGAAGGADAAGAGDNAAPDLAPAPPAAHPPAADAAAASRPSGVFVAGGEGSQMLDEDQGSRAESSSMTDDGGGKSSPATRTKPKQTNAVQSPARPSLQGLGGSSLPPRPPSPYGAAKVSKPEGHQKQQCLVTSTAVGLQAAGQGQQGSAVARREPNDSSADDRASIQSEHDRSAGGREASSKSLAFDPLRLPMQQPAAARASPLRKLGLHFQHAEERRGGDQPGTNAKVAVAVDLTGGSSAEGEPSTASEHGTASEPSSTAPARQAARGGGGHLRSVMHYLHRGGLPRTHPS